MAMYGYECMAVYGYECMAVYSYECMAVCVCTQEMKSKLSHLVHTSCEGGYQLVKPPVLALEK